MYITPEIVAQVMRQDVSFFSASFSLEYPSLLEARDVLFLERGYLDMDT